MIDEGTKRNLIFIAKWVCFWGVVAVLDLVFKFSIFETIINTPIVYCCFIGFVFTWYTTKLEAAFYDQNRAIMENMHTVFMLYRLPLLLCLFLLTNWIALIGYALAFPFIHDGAYYKFRNELNPDIYRKKWWDQSKMSTAKMTKIFTPVVRTILFIISIGVLVLAYIYSCKH